jgi:hypothetical protein
MENASEIHKDIKNTTLQMGGICDGHLVVTDSLHLLLVIHTRQEDGTMMQVVPQHFLATTYFRASDCFHMAGNAWTWLDLVGRHLLPLERYTTIKGNIVGNLESYKSIQLERVWLGVYGQGSMYNLAWELRNYEEGNEDPELYTIISGLGAGQLEANRRYRK